jgi:hypothetical protein
VEIRLQPRGEAVLARLARLAELLSLAGVYAIPTLAPEPGHGA